MGLLYIFPSKENELDDRIHISDHRGITLKTYGLPMIFWGYLAAILVLVFVMGIAIKNPIETMIDSGDPINGVLAWIVLFTLIGLPLSLIGFFFFEKWIVKKENEIQLVYKIFWVTFFKRKFKLQSKDSFEVHHHIDSPNMAKRKKKPELRAFENSGYFELYAVAGPKKKLLIDRHSRRADLQKMANLMAKF